MSAAGAVTTGMTFAKVAGSPLTPSSTGWYEGMEIHPTIPNTRVVTCFDQSMAPEIPLAWEIDEQNSTVDADRVSLNIDKMAIALADLPVADSEDIEANALAAWRTIFQKPPEKEWSEVNVAIKIVGVGTKCCPRFAVIGKLARALGTLGVPMEHIKVFDYFPTRNPGPGWNGIEELYDTSLAASVLPEGIVFDKNLGGTPLDITLPNGEQAPCVRALADGSTDILINLAMNKGHSHLNYGGYTACLKNHIGTLVFNHPGQNRNVWPETLPGSECLPLLIDMNKSSAIMGGTPTRQQLCFIDSIWAANTGNVPGNADIVPLYRLMMGTHPALVDYLLVKDIRDNQDVMPDAREINWDAIDQFMSAFGYDTGTSDIQELHLLDALAYEPEIVHVQRNQNTHPIGIMVDAQRSSNNLSLTLETDGEDKELTLEVHTLQGRRVRSFFLTVGRKNQAVHWDGRDQNNMPVLPGTYLVSVSNSRQSVSGQLVLR